MWYMFDFSLNRGPYTGTLGSQPVLYIYIFLFIPPQQARIHKTLRVRSGGTARVQVLDVEKLRVQEQRGRGVEHFSGLWSSAVYSCLGVLASLGLNNSGALARIWGFLW